MLSTELASAGQTCLTTTNAFAPGALRHPPIDHVCAGPGAGRDLRFEVEGWDSSTADGDVLSEHGGVLASLELNRSSVS